MSSDLRNRVLVITGASSGIGAATAVACARAGMDVVLNGRRSAQLQAVADQVRHCGRAAEIVVGDVTEPGLSARLLDTAQQHFGRFDVVFANAGYGFKMPAHELDPAELRRIFEVNFFAAFELLREAARRLLAERRPGHLLMTSSAIAKFTLPNFAAYSATKAAQNHFCRAMRMELRRFGIEVSSVHPVTTRTEFFREAARLEQRAGWQDPAPGRTLGPFVQSPEKVANAIVRCLRRPRPEVWTSGTTRLIAGLLTIFPRLLDLLGRYA
jgi:NAD(P)-dependent dehydrogenase (short-subunit alcohol dehydrogenase family)